MSKRSLKNDESMIVLFFQQDERWLYPSKTLSRDNVKMTLKWIGNDWKTFSMTFNDHFGVILISFWYHNNLLFCLAEKMSSKSQLPKIFFMKYIYLLHNMSSLIILHMKVFK